jgi:hypothetical protein
MKHIGDGLPSPVASLQAFYHGFGGFRCAQVCLAMSVVALFELSSYLHSQHREIMTKRPQFSDLPLPVRWATYYAGIAIAVTAHQQSVHFIYVQF